MFETIVSKITEAFEPKVNEWVREAHKEGYKEGYDDASRRMLFAYETGFMKGFESGYIESGAIEIPETSEELEQTVFKEASA